MNNPFATRYTRPATMSEWLGNASIQLNHGDTPGGNSPMGRTAGSGRGSVSLDTCLDAWSNRGRIGLIWGPHGSGKTTWLYAMARRMAEGGRQVRLVQLRPSQPETRHRLGIETPAGRCPAERTAKFGRWITCETLQVWGTGDRMDPNWTLMVDGAEQLSWVGRWGLIREVRRRGWGLWLTSHRPFAQGRVACRILGAPWLDFQLQSDVASFVAAVGNLQDRLSGTDAPRWVTDDEARQVIELHGGNMREAYFELYDRFARRADHGETSRPPNEKTVAGASHICRFEVG